MIFAGVGSSVIIDPINDYFEVVSPSNNYNYTNIYVSSLVNSNVTVYGKLNGNVITIPANKSFSLLCKYGLNTLDICYENESGEYCSSINFTIFDPPYSLNVPKHVYGKVSSWSSNVTNSSWIYVNDYLLKDGYIFITNGENIDLSEGQNNFVYYFEGQYNGITYMFQQDVTIMSYSSPSSSTFNFMQFDITSIYGFIKRELSRKTFFGISMVFVIVCGLFAILYMILSGDFASKLFVTSFSCAFVYLIFSAFIGLYPTEVMAFLLIVIISVALKFFGSD